MAGLSIIQLALLLIVCAGIVAVVMVILKQIGVAVPEWIVRILWIVFAVVVGVVAIKFIASLF
jgi:hypothetical protein